MAVARKPKTQGKGAPSIDVDALIAKGGEVSGQQSAEPDVTIKTIPLRIRNDFLKRIDSSVKAQPIKTPRNTWILQAIMEKLERDEA